MLIICFLNNEVKCLKVYISDLSLATTSKLLQFSSGARSCEPQHARPPCPSTTARVHHNSYPLNQWCHPTISFSVVTFFSGPQSFPAAGTFQMSQLFTSGGQSIGVSASTSVLPMNTQDLSPLGWTGWISLQSKGHSRVFSNTTVQKHQFFGAYLLNSGDICENSMSHFKFPQVICSALSYICRTGRCI